MKSARFEVYQDEASEWRWRLKTRRGEIVAVSGQGFPNRRKAIEETQTVRSISTDALLEEVRTAAPAQAKKTGIAGKLEKLRAAKPDRPQGSALVKPDDESD